MSAAESQVENTAQEEELKGTKRKISLAKYVVCPHRLHVWSFSFAINICLQSHFDTLKAQHFISKLYSEECK